MLQHQKLSQGGSSDHAIPDRMIVHIRLMRLLVLQCCLALLWGSPAAAQSLLSCDLQAEIVRVGLPRLAPYHPESSRVAALKKGPHWRFGPFDRAAFGFASVDIYLTSHGPNDDSLDDDDSLKDDGPVEIVVRLGAEAPRWFKVVPADGTRSSDEGILYGPKDIGDDRDVGAARHQQSARAAVRRAPWGSHRSKRRRQLAACDRIRPGRRRVPAAIHCYSLGNQGMCGRWDEMYRCTHWAQLQCQSRR